MTWAAAGRAETGRSLRRRTQRGEAARALSSRRHVGVESALSRERPLLEEGDLRRVRPPAKVDFVEVRVDGRHVTEEQRQRSPLDDARLVEGELEAVTARLPTV